MIVWKYFHYRIILKQITIGNRENVMLISDIGYEESEYVIHCC